MPYCIISKELEHKENCFCQKINLHSKGARVGLVVKVLVYFGG